MEPKFVPGFEIYLQNLRQNATFDRIAEMVNETASRILKPFSLSLRADGALFLVGNIGAMIVIPWETVEGQNFFTVHGGLLTSDIEDILVESRVIAQQRNISEISANLLLEVVATRRGGIQTRGLAVWGPS